MTQQDKAKELIEKHMYFVEAISESQQLHNAKESAMITVEEVLNEITDVDDIQWWKKVMKYIYKYEL